MRDFTQSWQFFRAVVVSWTVIVTSSALSFADDKLPESAVMRLGSNVFTHGRAIQELKIVGEQIITITGKDDVRIWGKGGQLRKAIPYGRSRGGDYSMDGRWQLGWQRSDEISPAQPSYTHVATNLVSGEVLRCGRSRLPAHSMSISSGGNLLALGESGSKLSLVDAARGETLARMDLPGPQNHSQYSRVCLSPNADLLLVEQPPGEFRVFDLKNRNLDHPLKSFRITRGAKSVFSSRKGIVALVCINGQISIRDLYRGRSLLDFKHGGNVSALGAAFDADGTTLATCGADGFIRLWNVDDGKLVGEIDAEERHPLAVAFTGSMLMSGGVYGRIRFWDVELRVEVLPDDKPPFGAIRIAAISPDGQTAALVGGLGEVSLWNLSSSKFLGVLPDEGVPGHRDELVKGHNCLAFTPDGKVLVVANSDQKYTVDLWNVETMQRNARCLGHRDLVTSVVCSPDGRLIVSGGRDHTVCAWDRAGRSLWQATGNGSLTLAVAPDGQRIYAGGKSDSIDIWNAEDGKLLDEIAIPPDPKSRRRTIIHLTVSHNGRQIAAVLGSQRQVGIINLATGELHFLKAASEDGARNSPLEMCHSIAFHPHRDVLAVGTDDGNAALYQIGTGKLLMKRQGHTSLTNAVAWSPVGDRFISTSTDGTAILWDAKFLRPK